MKSIVHLAFKDLRILFRDPMGAFFLLGFPVLMGLFLGLIMGGPSSGGKANKIKIAIVDQDGGDVADTFIQTLANNKNLDVQATSLDEARESVRLGRRVAMLVVPEGFSESAGVFWEGGPAIQLGADPSRTAEAAMLEGFVMESMGKLTFERFQDPATMKPLIQDAREQIESASQWDTDRKQAFAELFNDFDALMDSLDRAQEAEVGDRDGDDQGGGFRLANIEKIDVVREVDPKSRAGQLRKLRSKWDMSFPQAMLWGVMGCASGFSLSIVKERTRGSMFRLRSAPITATQFLLGKALACFLGVCLVFVVMLVLGVFIGMQPASYAKLVAAVLAVAVCYVGLMMTLAQIGDTEESVGGVGWAFNMIMAMIGGGMVPAMFLPPFMQTLSHLSPVRWSIRAVEGAVWREFTWVEMAPSLAVLAAVGAVSFAFGCWRLAKRGV